MRLHCLTRLNVPYRSLSTRQTSLLYPLCHHLRSFSSIDRPFQEDDVVLIRPVNRPSADGKLLKALKPAKSQNVHRGQLRHEDVIGKRPRDVVRSSREEAYRVYAPTLDEYVRLTPREVTPIYACDANLIVSLLDIHVEPPSAENDAPFEVLEAGTGQGGLTLHLARAIAAGNAPPPPLPPLALEIAHERAQQPGTDAAVLPPIHPSTPSISSELSPPPSAETPEPSPPLPPSSEPPPPNPSEVSDPVADPATLATLQTYTHYKSTRHAILHSCDRAPTFQKHARKIVRTFRRGIYYPHVDFHVCTPTEYLARRFDSLPTREPTDGDGVVDPTISSSLALYATLPVRYCQKQRDLCKNICSLLKIDMRGISALKGTYAKEIRSISAAR
ncbi:hypothetical protein P152DRAFT_183853 [Eremomyces bilateralis CBS 781.70]|uniref:tRNA (adenine(58)-N(1))-methyltransferase catalytic subunit TRM61 n=1 Tax=Eremomyces bilateralis CBS 781.70 TaxID=1392243 RepID=A0A6G1GBB2_9PEZI|nr:uncharacterized protein P152DRAFT_183853 [Eremomyces bilateralis CBS 781.70]KAF1815387.1 hypothetical protein P152DRAFT_183853 [Eremomyces bilateralis CBS 781.70]